MRKNLCTASVFIALVWCFYMSCVTQVPDWIGVNPSPRLSIFAPIVGTAPLIVEMLVTSAVCTVICIVIGATLAILWKIASVLCDLLRKVL